MRIDHIAVNVKDLEKSKAFYERYFGATSNSKYHNQKTGLMTYFLTFDGGGRMEIMSKPNLSETDFESEHFGYTHLAFCAGGEEAVNNMTNRLRDDGYVVYSEPRTTGDGYYESCVSDPDGNRIEIIA